MNSYADMSQADVYMAYNLDRRIWDRATVDDKLAALATATRAIDQLRYIGEKADASQVLAFPRTGQTEVPLPVIEACIDLAAAFVKGVRVDPEYDAQAMVSHTFGSLKEVRSVVHMPEHVTAGIPSYTAWLKLYPFLAANNSVRLVNSD